MQEFNTDEQARIVHIKNRIQDTLHDKLQRMDARLQVLIKFYGVVSGGVSASFFHSEQPNDIDIYFKHEQARDEFMNLLKDDKFHTDIADVNPKYGLDTLVNGKLITSNATTFKNGVQIIIMDTVSVREHFDYIHTMPWYDCDSKLYHISPGQYNSIKNKQLVVNPNANLKTPTNSRRLKFLSRGWKE